MTNSPPEIKGCVFTKVLAKQICHGCTRVIDEDNWAITSNNQSFAMQNLFPRRHGLCINCSKEKVAKLMMDVYTETLSLIKQQHKLAEKPSLTKEQAKDAGTIDIWINNKKLLLTDLQEFLKWAEDNPTGYFNPDTLEMHDKGNTNDEEGKDQGSNEGTSEHLGVS